MLFRDARLAVGLTQEALADQVDLDHTSICRIERGSRSMRTMPYATVMQLAAALRLTPSEVLALRSTTLPMRPRRTAERRRRHLARIRQKLADFDRVQPRPAIAPLKISALVRWGYLRRVDDGYVRTDKPTDD